MRLQIDILDETRIINNIESCDDEVGQIELTREFSTKEEFQQWLKEKKPHKAELEKPNEYENCTKSKKSLTLFYSNIIITYATTESFWVYAIYEWQKIMSVI